MNLDLSLLTQPLFFIKAITLIILISYTIFTVIMFNQIRNMNKKIYEPPTSAVIQIAGILHIALALSLFLTSFAIL